VHLSVSIAYQAGKQLSKCQGGFLKEQNPSEPRVGQWAEPKTEEPQDSGGFLRD